MMSCCGVRWAISWVFSSRESLKCLKVPSSNTSRFKLLRSDGQDLLGAWGFSDKKMQTHTLGLLAFLFEHAWCISSESSLFVCFSLQEQLAIRRFGCRWHRQYPQCVLGLSLSFLLALDFQRPTRVLCIQPRECHDQCVGRRVVCLSGNL